MGSLSSLNPDRYFDPDPETKRIASELYRHVKELPILSPHGHVNPALLADNNPFPDPAELILIPDHYIFRMLYSKGIPLEALGIPAIDGTAVETDHRKIWQLFADHYHLFAGTPTDAWLSYEFAEVFGISTKFTAETAMQVYDELSIKLQDNAFLPRSLYQAFNIEVLTTTDGAADALDYHKKIRESQWNGKIIPCFRPDALTNLHHPGWRQELNKLSDRVHYEISTFRGFIKAIEERRAFFKSMGATSTDQGVISPYTERLEESEIEALFRKALRGNADVTDTGRFTAHMLMEMARMSLDDGLVMQIHPGSFRNHNTALYRHFGADKGADIPVQTEFTRNLHHLLNAYGNDSRLTLIVFTLDESTYSRELAPLAGHYPAMRLGPPWWFHDSFQGMTRFRERVTETAGIYNTVGFNDDTRAFPSIPARHDLSRRVDSNMLARMVVRHIIDMEDAMRMGKALAYDLVKEAYKL